MTSAEKKQKENKQITKNFSFGRYFKGFIKENQLAMDVYMKLFCR